MKPNFRRIKKLISFMENLPRSANRHFAMEYWYAHKGGHEHKVGTTITKDNIRHCGTTACALGWASIIPAFHKAGLKLEPLTHSEENFQLGRDFFGLNDRQAMELFVTLTEWGGSAPMTLVTTPKQWAKVAKSLLPQWKEGA